MGRKPRDTRRARVERSTEVQVGPEQRRAFALATLAWLVPGSGHLWLGRRQKGIIFLLAIPIMFAIGLWLDGRLFPFESGDPLVLLAAFADLGNGLPYLLARVLGLGGGQVVSVSFEYGNTFTIVSGLLNMLVCLDTYDVAIGRK